MKLRIRESNEQTIYVDLIRGSCLSDYLHEDTIAPDEEIKMGYQYDNPLETRENISKYLEPLVCKIRKEHCVNKVSRHWAKKESNNGLSNYVEIIFKHPYGIDEYEIEDYYTYTIRLSDHGHDEAKEYYDVIDSKHIVGKVPNDLCSIGWEVFETNLDRVVDEIEQHEIDVYGYPKTTL